MGRPRKDGTPARKTASTAKPRRRVQPKAMPTFVGDTSDWKIPIEVDTDFEVIEYAQSPSPAPLKWSLGMFIDHYLELDENTRQLFIRFLVGTAAQPPAAPSTGEQAPQEYITQQA